MGQQGETCNQSGLQFVATWISHFDKKANHNKNEALLCFAVSMAGSLLGTLFVTLGDQMAAAIGGAHSTFLLSKLTPSVLSLAAAFSTAWLQLRKPQQLWALYRTAQRQLEREQRAFEFSIEPYTDKLMSEKVLVQKCNEICMNSHNSWLQLLPTSEANNEKHSGKEAAQ